MSNQEILIPIIDILHGIENKVDKAMLISDDIISTYLNGEATEDLTPVEKSQFEQVLLCGHEQYSLYMDIVDDYLILIKKEVVKAICEVEKNL